MLRALTWVFLATQLYFVFLYTGNLRGTAIGASLGDVDKWLVEITGGRNIHLIDAIKVIESVTIGFILFELAKRSRYGGKKTRAEIKAIKEKEKKAKKSAHHKSKK